jgi:hypothetical protein
MSAMVTIVDVDVCVVVVVVDMYRSAAPTTIAVAIHVCPAIGKVSTTPSTVTPFVVTEASSSIVPYHALGTSNRPRLGEHQTDVDVPYCLHVMTRRIYSSFSLLHDRHRSDGGVCSLCPFQGLLRNEIGNVEDTIAAFQIKVVITGVSILDHQPSGVFGMSIDHGNRQVPIAAQGRLHSPLTIYRCIVHSMFIEKILKIHRQSQTDIPPKRGLVVTGPYWFHRDTLFTALASSNANVFNGQCKKNNWA